MLRQVILFDDFAAEGVNETSQTREKKDRQD